LKDVGGELVVVNVPLKPAVNGWPVASVAFHAALLATVTCALPAGCVKFTGQPFWMRSPFKNENTRFQPVTDGPVLVMAMLAPKPLPPSQDLVHVTVQLATVCANALDAPAHITVMANNHCHTMREKV
jgi:hypothetical protein